MLDMSSLSGPSLLEYARFHGVATGLLDINDALPPLDGDLQLLIQDPVDTFIIDLDDVRQSAFSKQERLNISKSGAVFLSTVVNLRVSLRGQLDICLSESDRYRVGRAKVEIPSLSTDHDIDMLSFRREIAMDGIELDLPLEPDDDQENTSNYLSQLPKQLRRKVEREKLDCTREVLVYLQQIRHMWEGTLKEPDDISVPRKPCRAITGELEPLTPPLLPRDPSPVPFVPSSPSMHLDLLSQPTTPVVVEHEELKRMFDGDSIVRAIEGFVGKPNEGDCGSFLLEPSEADRHAPEHIPELDGSPVLRAKITEMESLKTETPITPPVSTKKRGEEGFQSTMEIVKDHDLIDVNVSEKESAEESPAEISEMLDEGLVKIARAAILGLGTKADTERIRGVDKPVWCALPALEMPHHSAPWGTNCLSPCSSIAEVIRLCGTGQPKRDRGIHGESDSKMHWNPFENGLGGIDTVESPMGDNPMSLMLADENPDFSDQLEAFGEGTGRVGAGTLVQSPEKAIEGRDSVGDTVTSVSLALHSGIKNTVEVTRRRKRHGSKASQVLAEKDHNLRITRTGSKDFKTVRNLNPAPTTRQFSTSDSLDNFMKLRGHAKRRKLDACPYFGESRESNKRSISNPPSDRHKDTGELDGTAPEEPSPQIGTNCIELIPAPVVPVATYSLTLVLSTDILKTHRQLVPNLEAVKPEPILIFRDYSVTSNTGIPVGNRKMMLSPGSRHPEPATGHEWDADIIISPTTGILLTTTQATTQQYLPGQGPRHQPDKRINSPLRERIFCVCSRYEQLYVLVSHFVHPSSSKQPRDASVRADQKDMDSVGSLVSFCASLQQHADIHVLLVPTSPESLTNWILSLSYKHYVPMPWSKAVDKSPSRTSFGDLGIDCVEQPGHCGISFEDPTPWELFLRHAGLNPFAALLVIFNEDRLYDEHCSVPAVADTVVDEQVTHNARGKLYRPQSSLSRFVAMDPRERRRMLGPLLGERVLSRVERALEIRW